MNTFIISCYDYYIIIIIIIIIIHTNDNATYNNNIRNMFLQSLSRFEVHQTRLPGPGFQIQRKGQDQMSVASVLVCLSAVHTVCTRVLL